MNNDSVIGSTFEMSQRILILMNCLPDIELDESQIAAIDFIAVYAADFELLDENLHGYGNYRFSEYSARKPIVSCAVRQLVLNRLLCMNTRDSGFTYTISDTGKERCEKIRNSYAKEYSIAIKAVIQRFDNISSKAMNREIIRVTKLSLHEGDQL
ncbi:MAG: hypothetical protein J6I68_09615 [Butyrivibrio sp.]|uniref:ABC-three component system middle component 2 n=1 Tax=Butyrivibrio sp. TaxID=28121 RepID=UPI001B4A127F|nr:ABC-three component system middle component 2 [Butyrivibrio sp.]MBP3783492.1 hypothetical protein [Butyrivibrio sp.]